MPIIKFQCAATIHMNSFFGDKPVHMNLVAIVDIFSQGIYMAFCYNF